MRPPPRRPDRSAASGKPPRKGAHPGRASDTRPPPIERRAAPPSAPAKPPPPRVNEADKPVPGTHWLHGLHAVTAALANPARRAKRLLLTEEAAAALAVTLPPPYRVQAEHIDRQRFQTFLPDDAIHQGIALLVHPLDPLPLETALARSSGPVLLLDQVTDPRNVGAILRSAAAFGVAAVVLQDRHAPPETAALARAASGALEQVPIVREVNLSRAIVALQRAGCWVMGLAADAPRTLAAAKPAGRRVALVLGGEDAGLRRLQRETVDELVRLPIAPGVESLNVSAAAAVALYELARDLAPEAPQG